MKNNDPRFGRKLRKLTQKLSPVCGDQTLATFLMKGYQYSSPMARHAEIPIFDSDDDISDNELGGATYRRSCEVSFVLKIHN